MPVLELNCPGCGARVSASQKDCMYCHQPVVITQFSDVASMPLPMVNKYAGTYKKCLAENPDDKDVNNAIAMCFLKLKLYDKALAAFELAMEDNFDNAETFFYAAVCVLKGRKPFLLVRAEIDKAMEYINAALMIEERGLFYYFLAYIKYDYFYRKAFNVSPNYKQVLETAFQRGVSELDANNLFALLGQVNPLV